MGATTSFASDLRSARSRHTHPRTARLTFQLKGSHVSGQTDDLHRTAQEGIRDGGERLPHLDTLQAAFGPHDLSGVTAHVGGAATEAAGAMGAQAYATVVTSRSPRRRTCSLLRTRQLTSFSNVQAYNS